MKKSLLLILTSLLFFIGQNCSWAINSKHITVLPVDIPTEGSSFSIYPDTLSLIAADIVNNLSRDYQMQVIDVNSAEKLIIYNNLYKNYKELMRQYKDRYIIDYSELNKIAKATKSDNVLFISGGFDSKQIDIKPTIMGLLSIPIGDRIKTSYKINITATLFDPKSAVIVWEKKYSGSMQIENFGVPSQHFGENIVSISKIKKFSKKISPKISYEVYANLRNYKPNPVDIIDIEYDRKNLTKDGEMTKDGHPNSEEYIINNRKNEYKMWVESQL